MADPASVNPSSLSVEVLAKILHRSSGEPMTVEVIRQHIADGAPTNADGTLNLVHYAAWLVREVAHREQSPEAPSD